MEAVSHQHCLQCVRTNCKAAPECAIIDCLCGCGARFHACKKDDHELLCPVKKVVCINAVYGCTRKIARCKLGAHLEHCAASVVHCTMEWNRSAIDSLGDKSESISCCQNNENSDISPDGHIVSCGLRLFARHPCAEQSPTALRHSLWKDVTNSICSQFDLELAKRDLFMLHGRFMLQRATAKPKKEDTPLWSSPTPSPSTCVLAGRDQVVGCKDGHPHGRLFEVLCAACRKRIREDTNCPPCAPQLTEQSFSLSAISSTPLLARGCTDPWSSCREATLPSALDLFPVHLPRHILRPAEMYSFLCGHEFRRDQYASHYRNVHAEIHAGIDGWIEHRCPLFVYGCSYIQKRLVPLPKGVQLVYSPLLLSFARRPDRHLADERDVPAESSREDRISQLPFELLQLIALRLDNFSLINLSRVSHLFERVCDTVLPYKGIVTHSWVKAKDPETKPRWSESDKVWKFTPGFTEISEWTLTDFPSMAEHLKHCPFNQAVEHKAHQQIEIFPSRSSEMSRSHDETVIG